VHPRCAPRIRWHQHPRHAEALRGTSHRARRHQRQPSRQAPLPLRLRAVTERSRRCCSCRRLQHAVDPRALPTSITACGTSPGACCSSMLRPLPRRCCGVLAGDPFALGGARRKRMARHPPPPLRYARGSSPSASLAKVHQCAGTASGSALVRGRGAALLGDRPLMKRWRTPQISRPTSRRSGSRSANHDRRVHHQPPRGSGCGATPPTSAGFTMFTAKAGFR
jgi:hypothetical protein